MNELQTVDPCRHYTSTVHIPTNGQALAQIESIQDVYTSHAKHFTRYCHNEVSEEQILDHISELAICTELAGSQQ